MRGFDACAAKLRRMAASPPAPRAPDAADGSAQAAAAGLLYVSDADPGFARRRAGRGFSYRDADGATVRDRPVIERIRALAIPPAWTSVWICSTPRGHLQATGRDARGRKQYRYHPDWQQLRGQVHACELNLLIFVLEHGGDGADQRGVARGQERLNGEATRGVVLVIQGGDGELEADVCADQTRELGESAQTAWVPVCPTWNECGYHPASVAAMGHGARSGGWSPASSRFRSRKAVS